MPRAKGEAAFASFVEFIRFFRLGSFCQNAGVLGRIISFVDDASCLAVKARHDLQLR
jgi:hypothetical protein